jgi:hypothetical protein
VFAAIELYLFFDLLGAKDRYGDIPITELLSKSELLLKLIIFIVVAIGPFGFSFNFIRKVITKEYLTNRINIEDHLKDYFHRRFSALCSGNNPKNKEALDKLQNDLSSKF